MKQIILQDAETRINTLRHIFGIDKYKKILENSSVVVLKIREEKRIKEAQISNLDEEKLKLESKNSQLDSMKSTLVSITGEWLLKSEKRKKIELEKDEVFKKIEEKNKFSQEIEKTKIMVLNKKEIIRANTKTSQELLSQLKEFQNFIFDESKIKTAEETIKRLKKERELLYKDNLDFSSKITSFNLKIEDNKFLESKMSKMDICPTCLQNVDPVYKANVVNKANSDNVQYKKEIEELEQKRMGIIQKTKDLDDLISQK